MKLAKNQENHKKIFTEILSSIFLKNNFKKIWNSFFFQKSLSFFWNFFFRKICGFLYFFPDFFWNSSKFPLFFQRLAIILQGSDRLIFADVSESPAHLSVFQILREGCYLDLTTVGDKFVALGRLDFQKKKISAKIKHQKI